MFNLEEEPKENIYDLLLDYPFQKDNKKIEYMNVPCAFDIESSSFIDEEENKIACMYAFTLNINGKHILGRTWDEFMNFCDIISEHYLLNQKRRIIIYVHNLSYEFQFIRCRFKWDKVFSLSERDVVYALTDTGIEFRCSYHLTGYKLATLGNKLQKYKVEKMVGDLDYSKIRTSSTPLTDKELKYIYHDGLVLVAYIQELIEAEHNFIGNIPLTKTGYVRRYCREKCLYGGNRKDSSKYLKYRTMMKSLTITSVEEYFQLKRAYIGAHTHGNPLAVGQILKNVYSMDFTSSYPYVMLSEPNFPMSKGKLVKIHSLEEFNDYIENYCCIFDITFINIESITPFEHLIPSSKCFDKVNASVDNGKIIKADSISMSLNEVDFKTFSKFYKWDAIKVKNFRRYFRGYLPKDFILSILHLYKDKTELKGIKEREVEYMNAKENLNSAYGMCVTDICRDEIIYDENNNWSKEEPDYEKAIEKYNKSKNRFLFYLWGLYVTSFAKANLASGILELKYDYLYADTDSVKFLHYDLHKKYFDDYNKNVEKKLLKMCKFYHLNPELIKPKNIKGEEKLIGIWDKEFKGEEPSYIKFKYLGAKRYAYQYPDLTYSFTLRGCSKKEAIPYLATGLSSDLKTHKMNFELLDKFDDNMYIPSDATGKNCHTYFDYEVEGEVMDYLGNIDSYHEYSGVNIAPIDFTLSLTANFLDYILGLRGVL